jgi:peptidoglycan/LPS O-acetylase OafA/YrhL
MNVKPDKDIIRYSVATLLSTAAASILVYLWIVDLVSLQRVFGALLGSELIIFAMVVYIYYKPTLTTASNNWLLLGCVIAATFLLVAVQLGSR